MYGGLLGLYDTMHRIELVVFIAGLLLPSWPCRPSGLLSPTTVVSTSVFQLLPETPSLVATLSSFQHQAVYLPLAIVPLLFPNL